MAKHKAATEITIVQEERSAFAEFVDSYKWHGVAAMVVIGAIIVWRQRASVEAVQLERADWGELYAAQTATEDRGAALTAAIGQMKDKTVQAWANVDKTLMAANERDFSGAGAPLSNAGNSGSKILTEMTFPVGKDGAEATLIDSMEARISAEKAFFESHDYIYSNPELPENSPHVEFETSEGKIVVGLYLEKAPQHVKNMLKLVEEGYYDDLLIHRILSGEVIQAGDPNTKENRDDTTTWGTGGPGYTIPEEKTGLKHVAGALSGAKAPGAKDSSGSQFFITTKPLHERYDGQYVVYGQVVEGLEIVERIANAPVRQEGNKDMPVDPVVITKAVVQE